MNEVHGKEALMKVLLPLLLAGFTASALAGFQVVPETPRMKPLPLATAMADPAPIARAPQGGVTVETMPITLDGGSVAAPANTAAAFGLVAIKFVGEPPAAIDIRRGFGRDVPLMEALRHIAPVGWTAYLQGDVAGSLDKRKVTWRGGRRWIEVLDIMANEQSLTVNGDWKLRTLYVGLRPAAAPVPLRSATGAGAPARGLAPIPALWTAQRGNTLREAVSEWAKRAGWDLDWVPKDVDYAIIGPLSYEGQFEDAITGIFRAYERAERPLDARGNKTQKLLQITEKGSQR